jgi:hypothetical protein
MEVTAGTEACGSGIGISGLQAGSELAPTQHIAASRMAFFIALT